jgi:hypothetical protein
MPKIAEVKLSSCRLEVAGFRKNCDCGIAELRLRSKIFFKSCGIAIAEVLPSSCGIAIADSKKKLRVPTSAAYSHRFKLIDQRYCFFRCCFSVLINLVLNSSNSFVSRTKRF